MISDAARARVVELSRTAELPSYVFDLVQLDRHLAEIRSALPKEIQLYYAAKANSAAPVLATLAPHLDGIEVASGGELAHVRAEYPEMAIAFGGPGKTEAELDAALRAGIEVLHVESVQELRLLAAAAQRLNVDLDVLLRVNLPIPVGDSGPAAAGPALVMGGAPSPFGLDPEQADRCLPILRASPRLRLRGCMRISPAV